MLPDGIGLLRDAVLGGIGQLLVVTGHGGRFGYNGSSDNAGAATGAVRVARLNASPSPLIFQDQAVGTTSTPSAVTLRNVGNTTLVVSNILFSAGNTGDFVLQANNCSGVTLDTNQTCEVDVQFVPTTTGLRDATLSISSFLRVGSPL